MSVYYNENNPFAAKWLKELIKAGYISPGYVDERSILEVKIDDLRGYTQHHFFAGICGWSRALKLAGWPESSPVWTGSCPCQPFSTAGKQKGKQDKRHLWPAWFRLIKEYRPTTIFAEQVASSITKGWLDGIYDDLETEDYAVGATVLPACSIGAAHRRERLWLVGHTEYHGHLAAEVTRSHAETIQHYEKRQDSAIQSKGTSNTSEALIIREQLLREAENMLKVTMSDLKASEAEKRAQGIHMLAETVFRNRSMTRETVSNIPVFQPNYDGRGGTFMHQGGSAKTSEVEVDD